MKDDKQFADRAESSAALMLPENVGKKVDPMEKKAKLRKGDRGNNPGKYL